MGYSHACRRAFVDIRTVSLRRWFSCTRNSQPPPLPPTTPHDDDHVCVWMKCTPALSSGRSTGGRVQQVDQPLSLQSIYRLLTTRVVVVQKYTLTHTSRGTHTCVWICVYSPNISRWPRLRLFTLYYYLRSVALSCGKLMSSIEKVRNKRSFT